MKLARLLLSIIGFIVIPLSLIGQDYLDMIEQGGYPLTEIQEAAENYFQNHEKVRGSGYKQWKRWEYDAIRMTDDALIYNADRHYFKKLQDYNQYLIQAYSSRNTPCSGDWSSIGPEKVDGRHAYDPGIGRLTSIADDKNDDMHLIVGSQTGGVWKTNDGGANWEPISDFLVTLRVYSLVIHPNNSDIYYWGSTGAIFKTVDAGNTWQELNFDSYGRVNKIIMDELNPNRMWVSASDGIHYSEDAGDSWSQLIDDRCYDVIMHPTNPQIVYASGDEVWKSTDGGHSFDIIMTDFSENQPKMLAVTADAPNALFVLQANGQAFGGLYRSADEGETFVELDQEGKNLLGYNTNGAGSLGQAPRNMAIAVSPTNKDEVFIAGINLWRSQDGGENFDITSYWGYHASLQNVAYTHADIEILLYSNGKLFIGSDGGIYRMDDPNSGEINYESITNISDGLGIRQIYRIGLSQEEDLFTSAGAQDNGTARLLDDNWYYFSGGDGTETCIIDNAEKTIFSSSQNGTFLRSKDQGITAQPVPGLSTLQGQGKWVTAFEKDPIDTNVVYAGYDVVYRSQDLGETFDTISQLFYPSHIKIAPTGNDTIYAASWRNIYMTTDGGQTDWERIIEPVDNLNEINAIAIHPRNAKLVAMAVAGSTKVLVTRDAGENWEQWADGLPSFQALTIVWQDNDMEALYLGMDVGIYYSDKHNRSWLPFSYGLPNVQVNELEIHAKSQMLFAATYGRGLWMSPLCDFNVDTETHHEIDMHVTISPNPVIKGQRISIQTNLEDEVELTLFDQSGHAYYRESKVDLRTGLEIPTKQLTTGLYYLMLRSQNHVTIKKLIVL